MRRTKAPDDADAALGRRLKSLRIRRELSQTALGDALDVSFQQIRKYESGTHRLRVSQLRRIGEALGVSATELATELLEIPKTDTREITDMIDTTVARRLMVAFQSLPSGERRCLADLAEEMAARR